MVIIALLIAAACYAVVYRYRRSRAGRLAALTNPPQGLPPPTNGPAGIPPAGEAGGLESGLRGGGSSQAGSQDPLQNTIHPLK